MSWITNIDERRKTHEKLQRSEAFLAQGQQISQTGSFGWSVSGGELYWSEETYNIVECDRASKPARLILILQYVFIPAIGISFGILSMMRPGKRRISILSIVC